jgi:hypothetical protein
MRSMTSTGTLIFSLFLPFAALAQSTGGRGGPPIPPVSPTSAAAAGFTKSVTSERVTFTINAGSTECAHDTGDDVKYGPTRWDVAPPGTYALNLQVEKNAKAEGWKELWCAEKPEMRVLSGGHIIAFYVQGYADCGSGGLGYNRGGGHATLICDVSYDRITETWTPPQKH